MRRLTLSILLAALLLVVTPLASGAAAGLTVTEMAVTTKVVKGKPIDAVRRIAWSSVKVLHCFTRVSSGADGNSRILHRWYREGTLVREAELPVSGRRWRTYSSMAIDRSSIGNWRVDAVDGEGRTLRSVSFRIN
jgi:hypothetical protein